MSIPLWRAWEGRLARRVGAEAPAFDHGLPLPSAELRVRVISDANVETFLDGGRRTATVIERMLADEGVSVTDVGRLLDFGCGCCRVARHWDRYPSIEVHGCDHDATLTAWSRDHLPFVEVRTNELAPPLPYPDAHFDFVYAISVFTHLTEELCDSWMNEMRRVIAPGGLLLVTTHGESLSGKLRPKDRAAFEAGKIVVQFGDAAGSNLCTTFHPESYMRRPHAEFTACGVVHPEEHEIFPQDVWLLRRAVTNAPASLR